MWGKSHRTLNLLTLPLLLHRAQPSGVTCRDPESLEEQPLVPGLTPTQNALRWGFVQKVHTDVYLRSKYSCKDMQHLRL